MMYCHFLRDVGDSLWLSGVEIDWSMTDALVVLPLSLADALVTGLKVADFLSKTGISTALLPSLSRLGVCTTSTSTSQFSEKSFETNANSIHTPTRPACFYLLCYR